jgi:GTPase SAR1 family protein
MSTDNEYLKICVLGSASNLTTAFIRYFAENKFEEYLPTLGVDITTKIINVDDNQVKLLITDTARQESFGTLHFSCYRTASAALIIFNKGDRQSFEMAPYWMNELRKHVPSDLPVALVGINTNSETVSSTEGQRLARKFTCKYFEYHLSDHPPVDDVFEFLARQAIKE